MSGSTHRASIHVERAVNALVAFVERTAAEADPSRVADLGVAARAAWRGGIAACEHYDGHLEISLKGENDPVTAADHASNRAILDVLSQHRQQDVVLSEESTPPDESRRGGRLWVVDPLDGTREFIAHNGEFSIMVGLAESGRAVLGAVYEPAIGRLYAGIVGGGAWIVAAARQTPEIAALALSSSPGMRQPIRFARSRSHPDERLRHLVEELGQIEEVISGSVGIKCALVARGMADLYVHPVPFLKEWDTCAPEAVLRGAGGTVTDCAGRPLRYGKADPPQTGGIFAATDAAWRYARPIVAGITAPMFEDENTQY